MARRFVLLAAALLLLSPVGCRYILRKDGSFQEISDHANRLDYEMQCLCFDVKELVFGVDVTHEDSITSVKVYD